MKSLPILYLLCLSLIIPSAWSQDAPVFKAGAATSNITPWRGLSLAGSMRDRKMTLVHDELHTRAIVLDDGTARIALATIDSCMVPRDIIIAAKAIAEEATGIRASHMLIAATHTHSAPCSTPVFQSDPDPDYSRFLTQRAAEAIINANHRRQPARIGYGSGSLPDEVFNRRWFLKEGTMPDNPFGKKDTVKMNPPRASENLVKPAGPIDPEIAFLALEDLNGKPLALLANYSLHYVGGTGGGETSGDYFTIFTNRIAQMLGQPDGDGPFVGIMSNGTSGDINNVDFTKSGKRQAPYEQMTIVANKAAGEVFRAYQDVEFVDWVQLDAAELDLELGVRKPTAEEVTEAKAVMAKADGPVMKTLQEIYARETVQLDDYPNTVPVRLQALRLGDWAISAIPCEVFVEIGLELKAKTPFKRTFTMELANGYNGYLPTAKQHSYGGYETWRAKSSYLEVTASSKIISELLKLHNQIAPKK